MAITLRSVKGSALTQAELDANFQALTNATLAASFLSLAVSSVIGSTVGNNGIVLNCASATNGWQVLAQHSNTTGATLLGTEGATPAQLAIGALAYDSILLAKTGLSLSVSNGTVLGLRIAQSTGAVAIPQHQAGTPSWVAGDKYLVVDVNGNIHVSATGPGS